MWDMIGNAASFLIATVIILAILLGVAVAVLLLGGACWGALAIWKAVFAFFV